MKKYIVTLQTLAAMLTIGWISYNIYKEIKTNGSQKTIENGAT